MKKLICVLLSLLLLLSFPMSAAAEEEKSEDFVTNYSYIFVHGLSGWGSYDKQNKMLKYWGMFGGDLMKHLNKQGFHCYAASVAPHGSAWDRACELYAQLSGSVVDYDNANYDMLIDNAAAMNETLSTLEKVYYFSYPCNSSVQTDNGTYAPDESKTELLFIKPSTLMGRYTGTTPNGYEVDETWFMNDGLVNTISATAPFNAPQQPYTEGAVSPGIWNVMPVYGGDHMSLQGGLFKKNDVRGFNKDLLTMINTLEEP